ncbi:MULTISPECIES: SRPBCC family protein [unclassified Kribbella]|uniref:SRPBCC family protein n=1 Tax=unclassified Kribbella TaxID=2644121 RepID=UPI0033F748B6
MTEPLVLTARAKTGIDAVQQALTDPKTLNLWLGEHANVDLPGTFEFWGRYIPEGDAPHQRVLEYDGRTLKLAWTLGGEETTTEITLVDEGPDATLIKLSQTGFDYTDLVAGGNIRGVLQTFWALALANLVDHLEGRELTPRQDFTSTDFSGEVLIDAPVAQVYDSLVDSEKVSAWFGYPIGIEPEVGGRYAMGGFDSGMPPAKVVDLVEGSKMSVDWGPAGVSTWELAESEGKTRLTFVMSGFDTDNAPYSAWLGWLSGVAELRRYNEQANWQPIWVA